MQGIGDKSPDLSSTSSSFATGSWAVVAMNGLASGCMSAVLDDTVADWYSCFADCIESSSESSGVMAKSLSNARSSLTTSTRPNSLSSLRISFSGRVTGNVWGTLVWRLAGVRPVESSALKRRGSRSSSSSRVECKLMLASSPKVFKERSADRIYIKQTQGRFF